MLFNCELDYRSMGRPLLPISQSLATSWSSSCRLSHQTMQPITLLTQPGHAVLGFSSGVCNACTAALLGNSNRALRLSQLAAIESGNMIAVQKTRLG